MKEEKEKKTKKSKKKEDTQKKCPDGYRGEDCDEEIWAIENDISFGKVYERKKHKYDC